MNYEVFEVFLPHVDLDRIKETGNILRENRYSVLYGGRASGKSVFAAKTLALEGYLSPKQILCCRLFQNSISDSSLALIWEQIVALGLDGFYTKTKNEIIGANSTRFFFRGLKTNPESLKSVARIDRVFADEAESIDDASWNILTPSIRTPGARFLICFNPRSIMDSTYQKFVISPPTGAIVTKANWQDNPYMPTALIQEKDDMKLKDPDNYLHVWEGEPISDSELAIIPPKWARACIDIHKALGIEAEGFKRLGFDVSGGGKDANANVMLHGQVVTFAKEFRQSDPVSASYDTWENVLTQNADECVFDVIGVGSSVGQTLKKPQFEHKIKGNIEINVIPFNAGGAVENKEQLDPQSQKKNKELYSGIKAQLWWRLRYRCQQSWLATQGMEYDRDAVLSFDSEMIEKDTLEKLLFEISAPNREYMGSKLRVEPKDKMKARGINSPNLADALIMADYQIKESSLTSVLSKRLKRRR